MAAYYQEELLGSIKGLLASGAYSDFTIVCGDDTYAVHKSIICPRSEYFSKALSFQGKEATDGKIVLKDDDPATIKLMLQFIYEGDYDPMIPDEALECASEPKPPANFPHTCCATTLETVGPRRRVVQVTVVSCGSPWVCPHHGCGEDCNCDCTDFVCDICEKTRLQQQPRSNESPEQLLTHARVYEAADKYGLLSLKELARAKFARCCSMFCKDESFAAAAHIVYTSTPDIDKGLRDIVVQTLSENMELMKEPEIESLLSEFNRLAFGLLKVKSEQYGWQ